MTTVLTLVNHALNEVQEPSITAEEFDSGTEGHHMLLRTAFAGVMYELLSLNKDQTKVSFTLSLVQAQAQYDLSFDYSLLSSLSLYVITAGTDDYKLPYIPETEFKELYPDTNDIPSGKPSAWSIESTTTETKKLRIYPTPDNSYTVKGYRQLESSSVYLSTDDIMLGRTAELCIQQYLMGRFKLSQGMMEQATYHKTEYEKKKGDYLCMSNKQNVYTNILIPSQVI